MHKQIYTAWCSEIGSLTSLDAPELHASSDVREPISLHQAVQHTNWRHTVEVQLILSKAIKSNTLDKQRYENLVFVQVDGLFVFCKAKVTNSVTVV